ncbi:unnamed protein product, partial [marine sediment metagenome]
MTKWGRKLGALACGLLLVACSGTSAKPTVLPHDL